MKCREKVRVGLVCWVCSFLKEVSLVIPEATFVALELIVVRCIYSSLRRPCTCIRDYCMHINTFVPLCIHTHIYYPSETFHSCFCRDHKLFRFLPHRVSLTRVHAFQTITGNHQHDSQKAQMMFFSPRLVCLSSFCTFLDSFISVLSPPSLNTIPLLPFLFPRHSSHPSPQQWQSLRRADVSPDVAVDWLETRRAEGSPRAPSPLLSSSSCYIADPFGFCWISLASVLSHTLTLSFG